MPRKFKSEEEKRIWIEKMKELKLKKKMERQNQSQSQTQPQIQSQDKPNLPPPESGYIWVKSRSDILMLPQWLADDLIRKGEVKRI